MRVQISIVSYKTLLLKKFVRKAKIAFNLNVTVSALPTKNKFFTILKSPHVNKKSREQFCLEIHKKVFFLKNVNLFLIKNFLKTVSSKGIAFKISRENSSIR